MRNETLSAFCNSCGTAISGEHQHSYFSSFSSILYQLHNHTPLNWKQAAKPLHIEQHRHSLSITKSYGEKGMQKKSCKTNHRPFSKIPLANEF